MNTPLLPLMLAIVVALLGLPNPPGPVFYALCLVSFCWSVLGTAYYRAKERRMRRLESSTSGLGARTE